MKDLYQMVGITKQALWKYQRREELNSQKKSQVIDLIKRKRQRHKQMGCRSIYDCSGGLSPVGRDAFVEIGFANGYRLKRRRNKKKTTWSQTVEVFPNLIEGKTLNGINQVWQSDIFYHQENGKDYYGISIIDVYSRRLLACHLSKSLGAKENIMALQQAIENRSGYDLTGCIFHSDRGSQYTSSIQKKVLRDYKMKPSMCLIPQENAYAERVQDTIKNYYLIDIPLEGKNLKKVSNYILKLYNEEKPHSNLRKMTPIEFEKSVENLPLKERPEEVIFKWDHQLSTKSDLLTKRKK
jgi:putative transposase